MVAVFITTVVGRVLWKYEKEIYYSDFDLIPYKI